MLPEFEFWRPRGLAQALEMLTTDGVVPVAGGTNLIVDLRSGKRSPRALVDLSRVRELRCVTREDGHITIGAGTTISDLLNEPLIAACAPALAAAAGVFANPLIRNRATVGGNLADASPAADTAPALLALDAQVELASASGTRRMPLADFITGVRRTQLQSGELLTAIDWAVPEGGTCAASAFTKVGLRKADAISVLSAAVAVELDGAGRCSAVRIALGALAPKPMRATAAEAALLGQAPTAAAIAEASRLAAEAAQPISDIRSTAAYRRQVTQVVVRRLLTQVTENIGR